MNLKNLIITAFALAAIAFSMSATHYVGGDISLLPDYEKSKAQYKDFGGKSIADLLPWLHEQGMNAMRVRLFNDPSKYTGDDKNNVVQDLTYIRPLCKQIVEDGFDLMLDFHYSDYWADPAKQTTPDAWKILDDATLCDSVYAFTRHTLEVLKADGAAPKFIQPGNEISYGMLWGPEGTSDKNKKKVYMNNPANWERFGNLLKAVVKACREVCPDAQIVIHTERVAKLDVQRYFYNQMAKLGVDYDIIGISYYPYFHGGLNVLDAALTDLSKNFDKQIMLVETGYPYAWEVPGTTHDNTAAWPYTLAGQEKFAKDVVATLDKYPKADGLFWWWMEYNAKGTSLSGWYNAPLFDSRDGKATPALKAICSYATSGVESIVDDSQEISGDNKWYDISGREVKEPLNRGIYFRNGKKIIR